MKLIILAAGQGTRLRPYTNTIPKCLVQYAGVPLLEYQLEAADSAGINEIIVIGGYKAESIKYPNIKKIVNNEYATTNMVYTMFKAIELFDGKSDIIMAYGDIIYEKSILKLLCESDHSITLVSDQHWKKYWSKRMDDPLNDVETFKISNGKLSELGKAPKSSSEVEGQYIGLVKFSKDVILKIVNEWKLLCENDDKEIIDTMYMTDFIQRLINREYVVDILQIKNGWMEFDQPADLEIEPAGLIDLPIK